MTVPQRTDPTTSRKVQCAAVAVAGQHARDSRTALSEVHEISRQPPPGDNNDGGMRICG